METTCNTRFGRIKEIRNMNILFVDSYKKDLRNRRISAFSRTVSNVLDCQVIEFVLCIFLNASLKNLVLL